MEVREILGYSTVKMTKRYAHLVPENLRNAVKVLKDWSYCGHTGLILKEPESCKAEDLFHGTRVLMGTVARLVDCT